MKGTGVSNMAHTIRPSIIAQRTISLLTGAPRKNPQRYSFVDPATVAHPVGIGSTHVHALAIAQTNANVRTTVWINEDGVVMEEGTTLARPNSLEAWANSVLKGEF
jgi:hypothetical protein